MATTRIYDIAKELQIDPKVIIQKCLDEGVPADAVKSHMIKIPMGLAQSIREWFSAAGGTATAIETKEHVDVEKVKTKPASKARKKTIDGKEAADETPPPIVDAPIAFAPAPIAPAPAVTPPPAPPVEIPLPDQPVAKATKIAPARRVEPAEPSEAPAAKAAPAAPAPSAAPQPATAPTPASRPAAPAGPTPPRLVPNGPLPTTTISPKPTAAPLAPAAHAPAAPTAEPGAPATSSPSAPGSHPGGPAAPRTLPPKPNFTPRMNVPTRPAVVKPVGQMLGEKQKVQLSGPKVIRVEKPEQLEAPRPRRTIGTLRIPSSASLRAADSSKRPRTSPFK